MPWQCQGFSAAISFFIFGQRRASKAVQRAKDGLQIISNPRHPGQRDLIVFLVGGPRVYLCVHAVRSFVSSCSSGNVLGILHNAEEKLDAEERPDASSSWPASAFVDMSKSGGHPTVFPLNRRGLFSPLRMERALCLISLATSFGYDLSGTLSPLLGVASSLKDSSFTDLESNDGRRGAYLSI